MGYQEGKNLAPSVFLRPPCHNLDVAIDSISADGSAVGLTDLNFYTTFFFWVLCILWWSSSGLVGAATGTWAGWSGCVRLRQGLDVNAVLPFLQLRMLWTRSACVSPLPRPGQRKISTVNMHMGGGLEGWWVRSVVTQRHIISYHIINLVF